jgi:hypothetical protein
MHVAYKDITPKKMAKRMLKEFTDVFLVHEFIVKQYVFVMVNNIIKEITYQLPNPQADNRVLYWNNVLTELDAI